MRKTMEYINDKFKLIYSVIYKAKFSIEMKLAFSKAERTFSDYGVG